MKEYTRKYPQFSLCGLNCGLCPRYQTDGESKCPGCGGPDFHLKHPSCTVITCSKKHNSVEFCFQCASYPCKKYQEPSRSDSFISYRNVLTNFNSAQENLERYKRELNEKIGILEFFLKNYNDGRRKNFYCIAVNHLKIDDLKDLLEQVNLRIKTKDIEIKEKMKLIVAMFEEKAKERKIELKLRK